MSCWIRFLVDANAASAAELLELADDWEADVRRLARLQSLLFFDEARFASLAATRFSREQLADAARMAEASGRSLLDSLVGLDDDDRRRFRRMWDRRCRSALAVSEFEDRFRERAAFALSVVEGLFDELQIAAARLYELGVS